MKLNPNKPVETTEATIKIDAGLKVGRHRFQLIVVDNLGRKSRPAEVVVRIQRRSGPPMRGPVVMGPTNPPIRRRPVRSDPKP